MTYQEKLRMYWTRIVPQEKAIDEIKKLVDEFEFDSYNRYHDKIKSTTVNIAPDTSGEIVIRSLLLARLL